MKVKLLNDLANDGVGYYFITVFKAIFGHSNVVIGTVLIILACVVIAGIDIWFLIKSPMRRKNRGLFISLVITFTAFAIVTSLAIYTVIIMSLNHYYGKYEADVKPVAVHNNKNVNGKWESRVTLEDKHKYKVKVKIHGQKLSKKDKINVATQKQFFNGREPEHKVIDYSGSQGLGFAKDYEPYNFTYKGHKMKVINHFR